MGLALLFLGGAAAYALYWFGVAQWREFTDDAYVAGHIVQITPQVGGTVRAVRVEDTDAVAAGEILVELDDADSRVALEAAEATLAQTVREVRALTVNNKVLRAQIAARQSDVDRLRRDLARREPIAALGAVPKEDVDHTRDALTAARSALTAAREQLAANQALTGALTSDAEIHTHPRIKQAAARVEEAWLAWSRSRLYAPVAGQVAKRTVQVGQRVAAGTPLMTVIPLRQLWVDANFKEGQLGKMRLGQPVTLTADFYGTQIKYRGRVAGLAAGTGSAFALLPAQNATGNWIKVVQRLPVRVTLHPDDLAAHPLRIGLSMQVTVDTHERDNANGNDAPLPPEAAPAEASASHPALIAARARVADIIRDNDIQPPAPTR
jgi:membrane fusion protein (multidrug efflux system)